jgi:hypothetical protein
MVMFKENFPRVEKTKLRHGKKKDKNELSRCLLAFQMKPKTYWVGVVN